VAVARVPEELKERLKREVSVQQLATARGIKLRRIGTQLHGLCPFHDDHNPSLQISPVKNEWHCKGCGAGGDVIEWVRRSEGVGYVQAVELLKRDYKPTEGPAVGVNTVPILPSPLPQNADDRAVMQKLVAYYHRTLKEWPDAQRYLEKRGLQSAEMVEWFKLGFSNRMLGTMLPDKNRKAGAEIRGQLERLGVFRGDTGREHLVGSLIVPIINLDGDVVQMYGRKINDHLSKNTPYHSYHLYLSGPMRGVWNEEAFVASDEIILCEALIDALTFWNAGYRNVTASYGVNGFTKDHRAAFIKHKTRRVYIAYDSDEAGNKAAVKLAAELMESGVECFRVEFPKNQDANEFARTTQPAAKTLGLLLNRAAWLGKGQRPAGRVAVPFIAPELKSEPASAEDKNAAKEKPLEVEPVPEPVRVVAAEAEERAAKEKTLESEAVPAAVPEPEAEPAPTEATTAAKGKTSQIEAEPKLETEPAEAEPVSSLAAVVASQPTVEESELARRGDEVLWRVSNREYSVRGLERNTSGNVLHVTLRVMGVNRHGDVVQHTDALELNHARPRMAFCKMASDELNVKEDTLRKEVGKLMLKLEQLRNEMLTAALEPPEPTDTMTAERRTAALALLQDPRLVERIVEDFARCGVVGEETNKLMGYLGTVSRFLDKPLAILMQSSSAAGKSSLMEAVLSFVPEDHRVQYSAMTGQSLFYMGDVNLKNKVLAIAEEEGAERAAYALKLLQSEGKLTIASTGKDPASGKHVTHEYHVEGPVMLFLTTTKPEIDEELLNRCVVLTIDEEREQTQAIHRIQREAQTLAGLIERKQRDGLLRLHQDAQRLLRPLEVVNELAPELEFPDSMTRTRRDHPKFLTLIRAVAFLHQHQRLIKTGVLPGGETFEYIEATKADVKLAKRLFHEVMGRSLDDMQVQTRKLLEMIDGMVRAACERDGIERDECRFSRRDVRAFTRWSDSALKRHLKRLEELEYLIVHHGGRGQSMVYELYYDAEEAENTTTTENKSGVEAEKSAPSSGQVRGVSGGGPGEPQPVAARVLCEIVANPEKRIVKEEKTDAQSRHVVAIAARRVG
jgi:DNA primase catalytic core